MEIKMLHTIASNEHLLELAKNCNNDDHEKNLQDIVNLCHPLIQNYSESFNYYEYLASYISEKDKYWDYTTNTIDVRKLLYTWITVGYRKKLHINTFKEETAENILYKLKYYNNYFWYVKIKRQHIKKKYDALISGLKNVKKTQQIESTGCGLFVGVLDGNMNRIKHTKRFLYIDNAYTPEKYKTYYSLSVNDLQYLCDYNVTNDRLKIIYNGKYDNYIFNPKGLYILVCPPSITMGEFYDIDIDEWILDVCSKIRKLTKINIHIRIKPNEYNYNINTSSRIQRINDLLKNIPNILFKNECSSIDAIKNSSLVYGFNSRILVESVLAGKPIICSRHCVCHTMSQDNLNIAIQNPVSKSNIYNTWLNKLCYSQWTLDEISKGLYLDYIKLK